MRSPSGKAKVCKTFIGGSIPPRASNHAPPLRWIFEPIETDPSFFQKPKFGCQAAYLFGRLVLVLAAKEEPWNGVLACTSREFHSALIDEYPSLLPHPVLSEWLYLPQTSERIFNLPR